MTLAEALVAELQQEGNATRRMLERVPEDKLAWKPHEKSMGLGRLATHVAEIPQWADSMIEHDEYDVASGDYKPREATSRAELLEIFDSTLKGFGELMAGCSDEHLMQPWRLRAGEQVIVELPRVAAMRSFVHSHAIHHRGQLSVYLRLLGVPLPQVYGPTADEQGLSS